MSAADQSPPCAHASARETSGFDPGDGWREVDVDDRDAELQWYGNPAGLDVVKAWVRVLPVPPLPTEPYTVIRPHWRKQERPRNPLLLMDNGTWDGLFASEVADQITGFEVLAEPWSTERGNRLIRGTRMNTLDRVRQLLEQQYQTRQLPAYVEKALIAAHREFLAVES